MKNIFIGTLLAVCMLGAAPSHAQVQADSTQKAHRSLHLSPTVKALAVPSALIAVGTYATVRSDLLDRFEVREERNEFLPGFSNHVDNYLQYAPIAAVYGLNALGVEGKHDLTNRTLLLIKSELLMLLITYPLKQLAGVPRPDTGARNSFPSGHTAQAFMAATFLAKEYGHKSIWYGIGAYAMATGIGTMRVLNNRHWVSDVLAGAGIGILSTNLVYLTHRYRWGKRPQQLVALPTVGGGGGGMCVLYTF